MFKNLRQSVNARLNDDKNESGFTLVELLVVITILGILAAIVVFSVAGIGDKGQISACKIDTRTVATAEEANFAQKGVYADEATLVSNGYLAAQSAWHGVTVGTPTGSYTITTDDSDGTAATSAAKCDSNATAGTVTSIG